MYTARLLDPSRHAFTGVADGDLRGGADPAAAARLCAALGAHALVTVRQVHGATVVRAEAVTAETEADAILCTTPGLAVAVRVADCVPILLAAPGGVAAIHAGWRGTAADIARRGLAALRSATGSRDVRAVVGPAICGRCYEVGPEVIEGVSAVAVGDRWRDGRHVDLKAANTDILRSMGVEVEVIEHCTRCTPGYWSHRGQGAAAGRQAGAIRC